MIVYINKDIAIVILNIGGAIRFFSYNFFSTTFIKVSYVAI